MSKSNKYKSLLGLKAFTLAEVLITLSIIGVIAALTIPALIKTYEEQVYLNKFKKVYSEISQAYMLAAQENSSTASDWQHPEYVLKPYLKIIEECPQTAGCFPNVTYKGIKGGDVGNIYNASISSYKYRLADGTSIAIAAGLATKDITIDINGDKGPNQYGYDAFVITLTDKNGSPYVDGSANYYQLKDCSMTLSTTNGAHSRDGGSCAHWIIRSWNMDYLHRDISSTEWGS